MNVTRRCKHTRFIISYILVLLTCTLTNAPAQAQRVPAYHVFGRCHDYGTALGLKAGVYATVDQARQKLADCAENGQFDVLLPVSATHLIFEMPGYRTVVIPVFFTPDITPQARFMVGNLGAMTALDSPTTVPGKGSELSLFFAVVDSINVRYRLTNLASPTGSPWYVDYLFWYKRAVARTLILSAAPGAYEATVSTADGRLVSTGELVSSEKVTLRPGLTFKAVRVTNPRRDSLPDSTITNHTTAKPVPTTAKPIPVIMAKPTPTTAKLLPATADLYFAQSSPDLLPPAKTTLDSVARLLLEQPGLTVTVTGYTDNVGNRERNVRLSEYRAKAVEAYLTAQRVRPAQIVARWKGPASSASPTDPEAIKIRSRRVVIQFMPQ